MSPAIPTPNDAVTSIQNNASIPVQNGCAMPMQDGVHIEAPNGIVTPKQDGGITTTQRRTPTKNICDDNAGVEVDYNDDVAPMPTRPSGYREAEVSPVY